MINGFQRRILEVIRNRRIRLSEDEFNSLALETYAWQRSRSRVYCRYCDLFSGSKDICSWKDIPALPVSAFKYHAVRSFKAKDDKQIFCTSGTTRDKIKGKHFFATTRFYDATLKRLFGEYLLPDKRQMHMVNLILSRKEAPQSSLSYMVHKVSGWHGKKVEYALFKDKFDIPRLISRFEALITKRTPTLILSTSFSLKFLLDYCHKENIRLSLPKGSRIMETGGYKGKTKTLTRNQLLSLIQIYLNVPSQFVVNEYGMTELSTQFYDNHLKNNIMRLRANTETVKEIPSWARVMMVHPETSKPVKGNRKGLIRIFDLANQGSVACIQTEDEGRLVGRGFQILGRQKAADLRGCSLSFEEMKNL